MLTYYVVFGSVLTVLKALVLEEPTMKHLAPVFLQLVSWMENSFPMFSVGGQWSHPGLILDEFPSRPKGIVKNLFG